LALLALLRLPSFFEHHWYIDERAIPPRPAACSAAAGLYSGIWSNKPPLQTWTVALAVHLLGTSEAALHTLTTALCLLTVAAVAHAARRLTSARLPPAAVLVTALLLGVPITGAQLALPDSLLCAATTWAGASAHPPPRRGHPRARPRAWPLIVGMPRRRRDRLPADRGGRRRRLRADDPAQRADRPPRAAALHCAHP